MSLQKLRRAGWVAVVCAGAVWLGWWSWQQFPSSGAGAGSMAADFTLTDLEGKPQQLSAYRGKLVLVNFWASWCAPCIDEMPLLVEAQRLYGARGLQILGPAMDDNAAAQPLAQKLGVNYPVMADFAGVDAAMRALGNEVGALPYSVLIDPNGKVIRSILGSLRREELQKMAEEHLPATS